MNAMTSSPDTQQIFDVVAKYEEASVVFPLKPSDELIQVSHPYQTLKEYLTILSHT